MRIFTKEHVYYNPNCETKEQIIEYMTKRGFKQKLFLFRDDIYYITGDLLYDGKDFMYCRSVIFSSIHDHEKLVSDTPWQLVDVYFRDIIITPSLDPKSVCRLITAGITYEVTGENKLYIDDIVITIHKDALYHKSSPKDYNLNVIGNYFASIPIEGVRYSIHRATNMPEVLYGIELTDEEFGLKIISVQGGI